MTRDREKQPGGSARAPSVTPIRLRLSRQKGFDLQLWSYSENGLEAVKVDRSTKWGNPFITHSDRGPAGRRWPMAPKVAVDCFRCMLAKEGAWWPNPLPWPKGKIPAGDPTTVADVRRELAGKNLACWCALDAPCHADVLLEWANDPALGARAEPVSPQAPIARH